MTFYFPENIITWKKHTKLNYTQLPRKDMRIVIIILKQKLLAVGQTIILFRICLDH